MSTKKNEITKTFAQWTDTHWNVKFINNIPNITQYTDPFGTDTNSMPFTEDLLNQLVEKGKAMKPFKIYLKEGYAFIHGSISDKGMEVDFDKVDTDNLQWFAHVYGTPKADINFTLNNGYYPGYVKCKTIVVNADSKYYETKFKDYSWGKTIYISPAGGPILPTGPELAWYQAECVSIKEGYIMPTADQIQVEPESMRQFLEFEYDFGSQEKVYNIYMYNRWDYDAAKYDQETSNTVITFPKPEATFYQVDVNKASGTTITNGPVTQRVDIGKDMQSVSVKVDDTNRMGFDPEVRPTKDGVTFNVDTLQSAPYKHGWVSGTPLRDVSIDIPAPVEFSSTSITLGANLNVGSGRINQWSVKGKKITEVIINCADGYEFVQNSDTVTDFTPYFNKIVVTPESEKSNIKFSITEGQLHITGTISNDVSITLPEPVKKTYTVTVELGENVVRESGGELTQEVRIGQPMSQIILKVDDTKVIGSFYTNTHNGSKDGVNMAVDTSGEKPYTKLTIGGVPTNSTTVSIAPPSLGYLVRITGGANTTHVSGSLRQYVNAGESIETVIFRCNDGYWFGKYNGGSNNSMSIKLNADKTELTLSGEPAGMSGFGDYDVRLEDAVPILRPNIKQGALLIMAPLTGTPVGNDGLSISIKAPKILNGSYGDFTFNNSDTALCNSRYGDRFALYDVPPGEYTATFTYEMSFDTKFTLTGNSSLIIDDGASSITETSMIYNLTGIAFGSSGTDFDIQASGFVYESIEFTTTTTMMRPDFPNESDIGSAQSFINDLQAHFKLDDQSIHLEISADLPYLVYSGGANLKSFVLIDTKPTKRIRKVTFAPYG